MRYLWTLTCALTLIACDSGETKSETNTVKESSPSAAQRSSQKKQPSKLPAVDDASWAALCQRVVAEKIAPSLGAEEALTHLADRLVTDDAALKALIAEMLKLTPEHQATRLRAEAVRAGQRTCPLIDYLELVHLTSTCAFTGESESCMRAALHIEAREGSNDEVKAALELACTHGVSEGCMSRSKLGQKSKWLGRACNRGRACPTTPNRNDYDLSVTTAFADMAVAKRFSSVYRDSVVDCWKENARTSEDKLDLSFELSDGRAITILAKTKTKAFGKCVQTEAAQWAFGSEAATGPHLAVMDLSRRESAQAVMNRAIVEVLKGPTGKGSYERPAYDVKDRDNGASLRKSIQHAKGRR